jgi:hypothetical protein
MITVKSTKTKQRGYLIRICPFSLKNNKSIKRRGYDE